MGVVLAPAIDLVWWGALGHGAVMRDRHGVRQIAARPMPAEPVAVVSRSHRDARTEQWLAEHRVARSIAAGSSLKFCRIAEGVADCYPRFGRTMEWDTGAGHAVLLAAGGEVRTLDGRPLGYGKPGFANPDFVASGPAA
jgi:3'(2'), 5'-bisphosphate nucleotidase